ncbi:MAG: hypothetical protein P8Y67_15115, partial [Alphaproteobacteria bacterium]
MKNGNGKYPAEDSRSKPEKPARTGSTPASRNSRSLYSLWSLRSYLARYKSKLILGFFALLMA